MSKSSQAVLKGLDRIREQYEELASEHGYCTSETERFESALARLIRTVAQDKDIEDEG